VSVSTVRELAVAMARGGAAALEASRGRLNDLNVYPVPDGDTGSNLSRTAAKLAAGLETDPEASAAAIAASAKRAALAGASGNSGIILSQIVAGFADVVGAAGHVDAGVLARALRAAADAAYRPVQQPIEGTMLTVIREMAETAEQSDATEIDDLVDAVLAAAADSVERTQSMLPVLRDAGVVDAGAAGLVEFARGAVAGYRGHRIEEPQEPLVRPLIVEALHQELSVYRYCTAFLVEGDGVSPAALERRLDPLGDCLLVVGEAPLVKVHLHTDDPGRALSAAVGMGAVDGVEIANMQEQARARERRLTVIEGGGSHHARLSPATAAILLDSTADLPDPEARHPNWRMVPLTVSVGGREYADGVEIDAQGFYRLLRDSSDRATTAAPGPGVYSAAFARLGDYQRIFVLPLSSRLSASNQAAVAAAADDRRVTVLDGRTVSAGTVLLADGIQRLLEGGATAAAVEEWFAAARDRVRVLIAVDTLEYLRRGGRISRAEHVTGSALGVRPLLTIRDGEVVPDGKAWGRAAVWRAFERFVAGCIPADRPVRVGIAHADAVPDAERLERLVQRARPAASVDRVCQIGPVVAAHGGPGTLGLLVLPDA
jgi:uncharacterized protein